MLDQYISLILFNVIFVISIVVSFTVLKKRINFLAILMTTILWGLIPWPYFYLREITESVLMITFLRLTISTMCGFLLVFIFIVINKKGKKTGFLNWFQYTFTDFKTNITNNLPIKPILIKDEKQVRRFPYLLYYFLLGFCYFTSILFYFLSYQYIGVVFSSIINTVMVLLLIAFLNLARRLESIDIIKASYLIVLLMAGVITVISTPLIFTGGSIFFGIIALSLTVVFWTGFVLLSGLDEYTVHEKERILSLDEQGTNFQLTKSMTKISFFFLFGLISLIIFVAIFRFLDVNIYLTLEIISFLNELQNLPMLLQNPWTWIIGIECTIFPYFIYFQSQNNWPSRSLNWDQWVAILAIFEPLASIFVGFFIGAEAIYNTALLTIAIVLMTIVMVLRYYHEKNSVKSVIFIKVKQHGMKNLINRLRYNPNISELKTLTGEYDIALKTFFPSYFKLKQFLDRLKQIDAVIDVNNLIEFELKIK